MSFINSIMDIFSIFTNNPAFETGDASDAVSSGIINSKQNAMQKECESRWDEESKKLSGYGNKSKKSKTVDSVTQEISNRDKNISKEIQRKVVEKDDKGQREIGD